MITQIIEAPANDIINRDILHIHMYFYQASQSYSGLGRRFAINTGIKQAEQFRKPIRLYKHVIIPIL